MAITTFPNDVHTRLNNMTADLVSDNTDWDADTHAEENGLLLAWCYALVKAIKARQHAAPQSGGGSGLGRDRVFEIVGGHANAAFMRVVTDIDFIYNEFRAVFNDVDQDLTNEDDEPWPDTFLTRGASGPINGGIMGSPNYTPGLSV